jgi:hypothetical protein
MMLFGDPSELRNLVIVLYTLAAANECFLSLIVELFPVVISLTSW